jgi:hypothetical protein
MNSTGGIELSREELYAKVWAAPSTQVAAELGISDVALAKRCKKLDVPKPSPGYWAKIAAGLNPNKRPLPPTAGELFIQAAEKPIKKTLSLPVTTDQLHPVATELLKALTAAKPDWEKRNSVHEGTLPEVRVTKALIERAAKCFHVILNGIEPLGILFCQAQGSYNSGYFKRGRDRLYLKIEEEPSHQRVVSRHTSWPWSRDHQFGCGKLTFSLMTDRYAFREAKKWKEGDKSTLGQTLSLIVTEIRRHFVEAQKRHAREAIERVKWRIESERLHREYLQKEAIRQEEDRKRRHAEALKATAQARTDNLLKAAEWWRLHQNALAFIAACEQRWRGVTGELTGGQEAWVKWARENAGAMSPFGAGYPDPAQDGDFDPAAVPVGGPYPAQRDFPRPPTMPKIPPPVAQQRDYSGR